MNRLAVYSYLIRYVMDMPGVAAQRTFARKELLDQCILWTGPDKRQTDKRTKSPGLPFQDLISALNKPNQIITLVQFGMLQLDFS